MVYRCIHGQAPQYLVDCCTSVTDLTISALPGVICSPFSVISALQLRPSGVLGRCPSDLEFTARWSAGSALSFTPWFCSFRLWRFINHLLTYLLTYLLTVSGNSWRRHFFLIIGAFSALELLLSIDDALYKLKWTLTLTLTTVTLRVYVMVELCCCRSTVPHSNEHDDDND